MKRLWRMGTVTALLLAFGCGGDGTPAGPAAAPEEAAPEAMEGGRETPAATDPPSGHVIDIGDVEMAIFVQAAPNLGMPNVDVKNYETIDNLIRLSKVTVSPPYPDTLPVKYTVEAKPGLLQSAVVVLHLAVLRQEGDSGEPAVMKRFSAVVAGSDAPAGEKDWPMTFTVDAFEGLPEPPDTLLLTVSGELLLMPPDTEPDTMDPEAADQTAINTSKAVRANPVRIDLETVDAGAQ